MNRGGFIKNLGLGLFGASVATQTSAEAPTTKKVNIEFTINGRRPGDKQSYKDWVYTDFQKFDEYLSSGNYKKLKEESEKLYNSLRWYLNRFKFEDVCTWEEKLIDHDRLTRTECIKYIKLISNKFMESFPLICCTDKYFLDWSKHKYYDTIITLGELHFLMEDNDQAIQVYSLIERKYTPYTHKDFKDDGNPFQQVAYFLNKYEHYEEAYKYALLDQEFRIDGTKSKLLKQLTKQLNKNG